MSTNKSIAFFDRQFEHQVGGPDPVLNPFELMAAPHMHGKVLDYGCGLGRLALAAARSGCSILALDASEVAIRHLHQIAATERLPIRAEKADLRHYQLAEEFDTVVSIGLLMFFDCATAERALSELEAHLRPGGTLVVNVLVEGTTYMEMFDQEGYCLFKRDALSRRYAKWDLVSSSLSEHAAPGGLLKSFATVVARKPLMAL